MSEESNPRAVKIGELLIAVGALTSGDLTEAIQIATRMGVPIGRVLVMSGCVTEQNLQQALELQSLIKDGMVELDTGKQALVKVFRDKLDLQTALKSLNWTPKRDGAGNKLGELLIDSNVVTRAQLERALEASFQSGMPLGGTLVLQGVLSAQLLPTILHIQEQIRDSKITRDEAVGTLQQALLFWARADQSKEVELQGMPAPPPREKPAAPIQAPQTDSPIKPYVQDGSSPLQPASAAAIELQTTLRSLESRRQAEESESTNSVSLVELIKLSGFCTQAGLEKAIADALEDSRIAAKILLAIGLVDGAQLNNLVFCQALIAKGKLRTDQALYVLNSVRHRKITLEQALAELGIHEQP